VWWFRKRSFSTGYGSGRISGWRKGRYLRRPECQRHTGKSNDVNTTGERIHHRTDFPKELWLIREEKTQWTCSEINASEYTLQSGFIEAELSAGSWNGTFDFTITLTNES
jgi:hypothetical protein